ncbi:MAG: hypothetical protein ACRC3Y_17280, partial [Romboutsia sp.]|uniref:hypothetical protein n=1 Tax=Romboutsia sp. TaxID=1965302 RepID=UPI003F330113
LAINKKSNKLNMDIKNYSLDIKSKTNNDTLMLNTINKYVVKVINDGNINCDFINLKIILPKEISYVENSLCIDNQSITTKNLSLGIDIGELQCNQLKNISFDFKVNSLPYKNKLIIKSNAECEYKKDNQSIKRYFSNDDTILNVENIALDIVKVASSEVLQSNDTVQIQTIINNIGSIDISNIYLNDNQNKNLVFVEDSVYIDGENIGELDPSKGIQLPMIKSGENILLSYSYDYVPTISSNKIMHFSNVSYSYELNGRGEERISTKSNILYLEGALSTFKEFSIENEYELKDFEPDIGEIISVVTNAKVEQYYEISSLRNRSTENEEATGKKVIIKGMVMDRVEYLINGDNTSLYMLERSQPFSIFINLPNDYDGEEIYFKPKCDSVFYKSIGTRNLFISSLISIEGSF